MTTPLIVFLKTERVHVIPRKSHCKHTVRKLFVEI